MKNLFLAACLMFALIKADPGIDLPAQCEVWETAGYSCTNIADSPSGSMVWLSGPDVPGLGSGLTILATKYSAVWQNAQKRDIYNSIFPPDAQGNQRPFAVISGMEQEMGL